MDYGVAQTAAQMLADAKRDATGAEATVRSLGLTSAVGITPMIGVNNSPHETFTLADAKGLLEFARANAWVGRLAMWSLGRDNGGCAGAAMARPTCSGLSQASYAFSAVFRQFGGVAARGQ